MTERAIEAPLAPGYDNQRIREAIRDNVWLHFTKMKDVSRSGGQAAGARARRGLDRLGHGRQRVPRSPRRHLLGQRRLRPPAHRRRDDGPAGATALRQSVRLHQRPGRGPRRPTRRPGARSAATPASSSPPAAPRRSRRALKLAKQYQTLQRLPASLEDDLPPRRLPRHDDRRALGQRPDRRPQRLRPARARRAPRADVAPLPLPVLQGRRRPAP